MEARLRLLLHFGMALTLLALGVAPLAQAHGGHEGVQQTKTVVPYVVTMEFPEVPFVTANSALTLNLFVMSASGEPRELPEAVNATLSGPDQPSRKVSFATATSGSFSTPISFSRQGAWALNVTLGDNLSASFQFDVYAPGPYQFALVPDERGFSDLFVVDRPAEVVVAVTNFRTGQPVQELQGGTGMLEHWTDDHTTKLGEREVSLRADGPGRLVLETTFEETGMYHLYVGASELGLSPGDRPYLHLYALTAEEARAAGVDVPRDTPGFGLALLAVAASMALLARAHRKT